MRGNRWKAVLRGATPPVVWRSASALVRSVSAWRLGASQQGEQNAAYYDRLYQAAGHYRQHYTASRYYFVWSVLVDRLLRAGVVSVLDVGCGTGQFAALVRDRGIRSYCGIDFSPEAVRVARAVCPESRFEVASALETDLFDTLEYDAVVCLELLEHMEQDLELLRRIPVGTRFYGSVPNFPDTAHVRYFSSDDEVFDRYATLFEELHVDSLLASEAGETFFLFEGVKAPDRS